MHTLPASLIFVSGFGIAQNNNKASNTKFLARESIPMALKHYFYIKLITEAFNFNYITRRPTDLPCQVNCYEQDGTSSEEK